MAELTLSAAASQVVVAPSTPVGRARPRRSQAPPQASPLLQSRAAAEKVAQLRSELELRSELVEKLQALSSDLVEKLAAVTAERSAVREELTAAHAELVHDAGLEARCIRLEAAANFYHFRANIAENFYTVRAPAFTGRVGPHHLDIPAKDVPCVPTWTWRTSLPSRSPRS